MFEDCQYEFMQGKLCLTNLLTTLDDITSCLDESDSVDVIFLDFTKAFDSLIAAPYDWVLETTFPWLRG